jgi:hypothetical protein
VSLIIEREGVNLEIILLFFNRKKARGLGRRLIKFQL